MCTTQKLNFSVKDFFSKCKQIHCEVAKAQYPSGQVPAQDTTVYRNLSDSWSSFVHFDFEQVFVNHGTDFLVNLAFYTFIYVCFQKSNYYH